MTMTVNSEAVVFYDTYSYGSLRKIMNNVDQVSLF
jgi:hypothetical protein